MFRSLGSKTEPFFIAWGGGRRGPLGGEKGRLLWNRTKMDQEHISNMQPASAPTPSGCLELLDGFDVLNPGFCF